MFILHNEKNMDLNKAALFVKKVVIPQNGIESDWGKKAVPTLCVSGYKLKLSLFPLYIKGKAHVSEEFCIG